MNDTNKEYIKMCQKAVEIQERYPLSPDSGDYTDQGMIVELTECYSDEKFNTVGWEVKTDRDYCYPKTVDLTWLPRQDQLQEMVKGIRCCRRLVSEFQSWLDEQNSLGIFNTYSMEQLWLAFVMKEKFNKTWNGEDWKEQEDA